MGAIQNSLNQMLGTVAGAATVGKHISNQNKANELNEIAASERSQEEAKGLIKEAENIADADKQNLENIESTKEDLENSDKWTGPFRDPKTGKFMSKDKYQTMRETALQEMEQKQKAIETQKYDLNARLDLYNKRLDTLKLNKDLQPRIDKLATSEQINKIDYIKGGKK